MIINIVFQCTFIGCQATLRINKRLMEQTESGTGLP